MDDEELVHGVSVCQRGYRCPSFGESHACTGRACFESRCNNLSRGDDLEMRLIKVEHQAGGGCGIRLMVGGASG